MVIAKPATPHKNKGECPCRYTSNFAEHYIGRLTIPSELSTSPKSASRRSLRIPDANSLPTPVPTQTSPSPSKKRRSIEEDDFDHNNKKSKRFSDSLSDASSPLSSLPADLDEGEVETECKVCFHEVDTTLAEMYTWPSPRPTMAQKRTYCIWHKTKEAEQEWQKQSYPSIDWLNLKDKLNDYNSDLERLIDKPETSHYRQELKNKTKGKIHSIVRLQQEDDVDLDLELGFFGFRGLTMM